MEIQCNLSLPAGIVTEERGRVRERINKKNMTHTICDTQCLQYDISDHLQGQIRRELIDCCVCVRALTCIATLLGSHMG